MTGRTTKAAQTGRAAHEVRRTDQVNAAHGWYETPLRPTVSYPSPTQEVKLRYVSDSEPGPGMDGDDFRQLPIRLSIPHDPRVAIMTAGPEICSDLAALPAVVIPHPLRVTDHRRVVVRDVDVLGERVRPAR